MLFQKNDYEESQNDIPLKCSSLAITQGFSAPKERFYAPMQLVAPRAVTMAVATDAMICIMNLNVSFLVMVL